MVVHVIVFHPDGSGRLVLLRRANTGFMDGYYALPGGHQEQGEGVSAAAARECAEELGIRPTRVEPVGVLPYRSGRHQGVNFIFSCHEYRNTPRVAEPELASELVWVSAQALPEPVADWLPVALELEGSGEWYRELMWD